MPELLSADPTIERSAPTSDTSFRARLPYTQGPDGQPRPYVVLDARGPNERVFRFRGLIDTGSDLTSMPRVFVDLFGYVDDDLESQVVTSQRGALTVLSAAGKPLRSSVVGAPDVAFELRPVFLDDLPEVLLGRKDFMRAFSVSIVEAAQELSLFKR